jgi:hypothetical protein
MWEKYNTALQLREKSYSKWKNDVHTHDRRWHVFEDTIKMDCSEIGCKAVE